MPRRCDHCGAQSETGSDLGGHHYCQSCYGIQKQIQERKHQEEEKQRQKEIAEKKHYMHQDMVAKERRRQERLLDDLAEAERRRVAYAAKKRRDAEAQLHRKALLGGTLPAKNRVIGEELKIFSPLGGRIKRAGAEDGQANAPHAAAPALRGGKKAAAPQEPLPAGPQTLSLSAKGGLPPSLSPGVAQAEISLVGTNMSGAPMAVRLEVSIQDSQKNAIAPKIEPRIRTIPAGGESEFRVAFAVPQDCANGRLAFSAFLLENAIYIGRQPAQSGTVSLVSQVRG